jgi:hypothetical protein
VPGNENPSKTRPSAEYLGVRRGRRWLGSHIPDQPWLSTRFAFRSCRWPHGSDLCTNLCCGKFPCTARPKGPIWRFTITKRAQCDQCKRFARVSNEGLLMSHVTSADRRCSATNTPAANPWEAPPVEQRRKPERHARQAPLPTLGLPDEFWNPPASRPPYEPKSKPLIPNERLEEIMNRIAAPTYEYKPPRIRVFSGGLPGGGRRR